ncbi:hypothetical protein [Microcoleus sp. PH2017_02_FOX_O_A]|nr:hypothetical protein [Microcoleus sp. PH2017_02_FOX_O_A]
MTVDRGQKAEGRGSRGEGRSGDRQISTFAIARHCCQSPPNPFSTS